MSDRPLQEPTFLILAALAAGAQLIEVDREEVVDTRLRRYYRLTATGSQRLADEAERLRRHAAIATRRLRASGRAAYGTGGAR